MGQREPQKAGSMSKAANRVGLYSGAMLLGVAFGFGVGFGGEFGHEYGRRCVAAPTSCLGWVEAMPGLIPFILRRLILDLPAKPDKEGDREELEAGLIRLRAGR